ncbi:hypothetical protein EVG20_g10852 [Dentipellis fragilis]|uniref:F-box domain-containing protein n=1 Tax=Dentipellis fragilis TaxID=205917 RepID=A0A4Y9XQU7_9AGAM|nr:hypothetical protein EVG20_g10852 [Dentipellis fragilis]
MSANDILSLLERLNNDALTVIVETLCAVDPSGRSLKQLSARIYCNAPSRSNPPPASWPYVRTMVINGLFATSRGYDAGQLHQILPHLVALRKIVFTSFAPGVSWMDLEFMLAAPHICVLEIKEPANLLRQDFSFVDDTPLPCFTEFIYSIDNPHFLNWFELRTPIIVARRCYMTPFIFSLHETLELLHIPAAMAPVSEMATMDWPCLCELKLYSSGHFDSEDAIVFARLCSRMPRLWVLNFDFLRRGPSAQTLIWPSDTSFPASFEHMEMVCLHYPDPKDMFYSHLPSTLRHLSLIDRPRYLHFQNGQAEIIENYPKPVLIAARDLLQIFEQMPCRINSLVHLEIAFHADGLDRALFNHIITAFPNLHFLQIHRYRSERETNTDIECLMVRAIILPAIIVPLANDDTLLQIDLARNLSVLQALCHFWVYLDLPDDKPRPTVNYGEHHSTGAVNTSDLMPSLHHHATTIAHNCSPTLEIIDFLTNQWFGSQVWKRWYVSRDHDGRPVVQYENDISTQYVYSERFDDRP